ncbi:MAG: nitrogenase component 1 [Pseudomonadota bacterium]
MPESPVATTNPCRMCRPLGACLAFRGIAGSMTLLHGSQGCSTYIRRFISSHYREPVDIASSALSEKSAVYGGAESLRQGIRNVAERYAPAVLGIATTCLTETIGDSVEMIVREMGAGEPLEDVRIIPVSTPSYSGSHTEGFHDACVAILRELAAGGPGTGAINLFPGFLSPADIRHLKEVMEDFGAPYMVMPDTSETLDGGIDGTYRRIPDGGTPLESIGQAGRAAFSIELGMSCAESRSASAFLEREHDVSGERLPFPIGLRYSDLFFNAVSEMALAPVPLTYRQERGRLVDAMVDAHKYLFGRRAVVYGDPDFVIAMTSFLADAGVQPVVCATGGSGPGFAAGMEEACSSLGAPPVILEDADFGQIGELAAEAGPDLLVGSSKGNHIARKLGVPLMRAGFPVHDRIGGQRILHTGYRGAMNLLDILTNMIIAGEEQRLGHGYSYM